MDFFDISEKWPATARAKSFFSCHLIFFQSLAASQNKIVLVPGKFLVLILWVRLEPVWVKASLKCSTSWVCSLPNWQVLDTRGKKICNEEKRFKLIIQFYFLNFWRNQNWISGTKWTAGCRTGTTCTPTISRSRWRSAATNILHMNRFLTIPTF
jgi:hypothetical protein